MLVKLQNSFETSGRGQWLVKTVAGILTKTITSTDQLNATMFMVGASSIQAGTTDFAAWTVVWDGSSNYNSGNMVLSQPTTTGGKTNWLQLSYDPSFVYMHTGTGYNSATSSLHNMSVGGYGFAISGGNSEQINTQGFPLWVRVGPKFVHLWGSTGVYNGSDTFRVFYGAMAVQLNENPYDAISSEASCKILSLRYPTNNYGTRVELYVSNFYNPNSTTTTAAKTLECTNLSSTRSYGVGLTIDAALRNNELLLVPMLFSDLSVGWFGGNVSELAGLWFASNTQLTGGEIVSVGSEKYMAINLRQPLWYEYDTVFLAKI